MQVKCLAAGLIALAGLVTVNPANAGDTFRLSIPGDVSAPTLDLGARPADLNADTLATHWRGGRGFRWGGWGGYRGGWGWGGFRGGYGWGGYRGGWGWGGARWGGYYGGWGRGLGWGHYGGFYPRHYASYSYYPTYYSTYSYYPSVYYSTYSYYPSYCYPMSVTTGTANGSYLPATPSPAMPRATDTLPRPESSSAPDSNGTYQYDGGPMAPIPMPKSDEMLTRDLPRVPTLLDTIPVSTLPTQEAGKRETGKWTYPAYGEAPRRTGGR